MDAQQLIDKDRVIDTINTLFVSTDDRRWDDVKNCFADQVLFDMSSLTGSPAERVSSQSIVDGWAAGLKNLEAIHHQAGNYRVAVKGNEADAFCYGIATHYRRTASGKNTRTFVGSYDFHLVRAGTDWRIDRFKFNVKYVDGNVELEKD